MKLRFGLLTIISMFVLSLSGCSCNKEEMVRDQVYVDYITGYNDRGMTETVMVSPFNTTISLTYFYESEKEKAEQIFKYEFTRLHKLFDRHYYYSDDNGLITNLRVINESNGETVKVDSDLVNIFKEGIRFTKLSNGKFNIGVGNLSDLWDDFINYGNYTNSIVTYVKTNKRYSLVSGQYLEDANGKYLYNDGVYFDFTNMPTYRLENNVYVSDNNGDYVRVKDIAPSEEQINEAIACTPTVNNIDSVIVVDDVNNTIRINNLAQCHGRVTVTLGALGKSYAAEKVASYDRVKNGNFLINAGQSTIRIVGKNVARESGEWNVGVTDSYLIYRGESGRFASYLMKLSDEYSVSTSSGDEKHYSSDNHYYYHIINPLTGYPNEFRLSVTAISDNAMYVDIVTTALMTMNMAETKSFLETLKVGGINVEVFIQEYNDELKLYASEEMKKIVSVREDEDYQDYLSSLTIEDL